MAIAKRAAAGKKSAGKKTAGKKTAGKKVAAKKSPAGKSAARKSTGRPSALKKTTRGVRNALTKLQADHDAVRKLFNRYERQKDDMSNNDKSEMVRIICGELTVHAQIEEEIFYPALRNAADDDLDEMLDEAEVEHTGAKDLIAQLQSGKPDDPLYDAKVTVLGEQVKHHAGEEERDMFRKARRAGVDLVVLGEQLQTRAAELKAELGLG